MRFFKQQKDKGHSDLYDLGKKALASTVMCLKWVREKRGNLKISPAEYIAESRLVIALDDLRKGLNQENWEDLLGLVKAAEECYTELWNEVSKRSKSE